MASKNATLPLVLILIYSLLSFPTLAMGTVLYADNFETVSSNWRNVSIGDNKDWTRDLGGTPSSGTGPSNGAGGSTYYMYLETSSSGAYYAGDTAILEGPDLYEPGIHLSFKYHMYGSNIGTLAVDALTDSGWILSIWSITGQQQTISSSPYQSVDIDLSAYNPLKIRLRAIAAGGYLGDIAIDDIEISTIPTGPVAPAFTDDPLVKPNARQDSTYSDTLIDDAYDPNGDAISFSKISGPTWLTVYPEGEISGTPNITDLGPNLFVIQASDGSLSSTTTMSITVDDLSTPVVIYEDDFEIGMGNWTNSTGDDNKEWLRISGQTPSGLTGPLSGADPGAYYLYFETSSGWAYTPGDTAILASPIISESNIILSFQYHMYGANIGTLSVDVLSNNVWSNDVWTVSGQQQINSFAPYTSVELDLGSFSLSQIRFRATAAGGYTGDIAIDNIVISSILPSTDQDSDGVADTLDLCPNTPYGEPVDTNGCSASQRDSDNDGVVDSLDAFPFDPYEWVDTDSDGIGNNADADDDNDGVPDDIDAFPLDSSESADSDGDGIGNNADPDDDNDGVPDTDDAYPLISLSGLLDSDGDGIPNDCDTNCQNVGMTADNDDDGDGVLDHADAFPLDPTESVDTDGDLIGNNADLDDDGDGLSDADELTVYFTNSLNPDSDGDGMPDGWEVQHQLLPMTPDSGADADGDGVTNLDEYLNGTDPSPPTVGSTIPSQSDTNFAVNGTISVTFSEQVDAATINTTNFAVTYGTNPVPGTFSFNGNEVIFTPIQNLSSGTSFTVTLTQGITDTSGNALATDYTWDFTTQSTYSVSGSVTFSGLGLEGVNLALTGISSGSGQSNNSGQYQLSDLVPGVYTITPSLLGYTFSPTSTAVEITSTNITNISFQAAMIPPISVPGDYPTIQMAIDNALPGGTILVSDGTYTENLTINNPVIIRSVNGSTFTSVTAANSGQHAFSVNSPNVTIEGFDIHGADGYYRAAIYFAPGSDNGQAINNLCGYDNLHRNYIGIYAQQSDNLNLSNNTCNNSGIFGINIETSSNTVISNNISQNIGLEGINISYCENCMVYGNQTSGTRNGIKLRYSHYNLVDSNISNGNSENGIHIQRGGNNTIINNTTNSNTSSGIFVEYSGLADVSSNTSNSNSANGITLYSSGSSNVMLNSVKSSGNHGIYVTYSPNCVINDNTVLSTSRTGIYVNWSDGNSLIGNSSKANGISGIELYSSNGNTLIRNVAKTSASLILTGFRLTTSSSNVIYLNEFHGSDSGASVSSTNNSFNTWTSPGPISYQYNGSTFYGVVGNFYKDHSLTDSDVNGITDFPKDLPGIEPDDAYPLAATLDMYLFQ